MRIFLFNLFFLTAIIGSYGQDTLTIYYKNNGKKTRKIENSAYHIKVINSDNNYRFQQFLTESNYLVQESELKSWKPFIEEGLTTYFDKLSGQCIAKGYYKNGILNKQWIYRTSRGFDTVHYSNTKIKYLSNTSHSQLETFLIVQDMPLFDYGEDLKHRRALLDKKVVKLLDQGNVQTNHNEYMDLQRQIININKMAFDRYKNKNLYYPIRAKQRGIQGTVYVNFIIDQTGKVVETAILRGVDKDLDKEAVRLINSMTSWRVGTQKGKPVRVATNFAVKFEL